MNNKSQIISNSILQKREEIRCYEQNIKLVEEKINKLKQELFQTCQHSWEKDWDDRSCHSSWVCKYCKLYKNPNYN